MKRLFLLAALCLPLAALAQTPDQPRLNKKNLIIREINTDPKGRNEMLDHETLYNADGHKLEEVEYDSDGKKKWTKRFEYDAAGKVSKEYAYDHLNRLQTYKTFEYNEFGRKKVQYTYSAKGRLLGIKTFKYIAQEQN